MNGLQPALERGERRGGACAPRVGFASSSASAWLMSARIAFQVRVVRCELQRRRIVGERGGQLSLAAARLGERAGGGEVFRCGRQDTRLSSAAAASSRPDSEQRPPECHACRQILGMDGETGAAGCDRVVELTGATVLLGELRKSNRRRVLLNPASKVVNACGRGHGSNYEPTAGRQGVGSATFTVAVTVPVWPLSSVTFNVTM